MARKPEDQTKFDRFVRGFGATALSRRLGVRDSAIHHWLSGANGIDPKNAHKIQEIAKEHGVELSMDEIYQHSREVRGKRRATSSLKPIPARV